MVTVQTIFTRPSENEIWYHILWPTELVDYVNQNYELTGKFAGSVVESEDKLTLTFIHIFTSDEDRIEWNNDQYLNNFREIRLNYNQANGIVQVSQTVE